MNKAARITSRLSIISIASVLSACAITPQPIDGDARRTVLGLERAELTRDQEAITGPVTLEQASARAIKYNLDYRIKAMETALAQGTLDTASFDLLPRLTAAAGYSNRDNDAASSSRSIITGQQSLEPSISSDRTRRNADLGLSWNVLDFGVSYYQAHQQADRILAAQERRRKTIQLIMQQVRQAWWQAAGAEALAGKIEPLLAQSRAALADSRKIEAERLQSPLETLNYQRQLLDIIRQLEAINDELAQAKPRLAALMNLEPGKPFELALPASLTVPTISVSIDKMEETALLNRPELMEARYNERIGQLETRKALAKLLPGVEFSLGAHYDSNSFLANNQWRDLGLRVSWNLLNVFNADGIKKTAQLQSDIAHQQKLALSMAVLAQTQVALRDYAGRKRQFELSAEQDSVEQRILTHTKNAANADAQGRLNEIRASAGALFSELRRHQTYAALQGAYGQMLATLGVDPLPENMAARDVNGVAQALQASEAQWALQVAPTTAQAATAPAEKGSM